MLGDVVCPLNNDQGWSEMSSSLLAGKTVITLKASMALREKSGRVAVFSLVAGLIPLKNRIDVGCVELFTYLTGSFFR